MGDDGLFREEALRRFREGGTHGQVLRLAPGWITVAFFLLIAGAAAATAFLFFLTVPVAVHGPAAAIGKERVLALLPASRRDEIARERYLLWKQGEVELVLQLESIEPRSVTREEGQALAGGIFAGQPLAQTSLLVWATLAPGYWLRDGQEPGHQEVSLQGSGTVSVLEEQTPLIDLLLARKH
jgi:hypothetical protein